MNQSTYTRLLSEESTLIARCSSVSIILSGQGLYWLPRWNADRLIFWIIAIVYAYAVYNALSTLRSVDHGDLLHNEDSDPEHELRLNRQIDIVRNRQKTFHRALMGIVAVFICLFLEVLGI